MIKYETVILQNEERTCVRRYEIVRSLTFNEKSDNSYMNMLHILRFNTFAIILTLRKN